MGPICQWVPLPPCARFPFLAHAPARGEAAGGSSAEERHCGSTGRVVGSWRGRELAWWRPGRETWRRAGPMGCGASATMSALSATQRHSGCDFNASPASSSSSTMTRMRARACSRRWRGRGARPPPLLCSAPCRPAAPPRLSPALAFSLQGREMIDYYFVCN